MEVRNKIVLVMLVVVVGATLLVMWLRPDFGVSSPDDKIRVNMGFNACLVLESSALLIPPKPAIRNRYVETFTLDTTRHFYSKSIVMGNDTFHISTITKVSFPEATKLLQSKSGTTIAMQEVRAGKFPVFMYYGKSRDEFMCRILLSQKAFKAAVMIDAISKDSTAIESIFRDPTWTEKIIACI